MFVREFGNNRAVRSLVRNLSDRLHERDFRTEITQQTVADVLDEAFMTQAVAAWLKIMVPEYVLSKNFKVQTADTGSGYIFATGLDFEEINKFYHRRIPASHSTVTPAWLLTQVQEMRKEISYSADASSDIWLGPGEAAMLKTRIDVLASRASKSQSNISTFHDVEFEGRTFKETINSGHSSIAELLNLLENDETRKFKLWLNAQPSAGVLVKEYDRSIFQKTGWTHRLPFKLGKICTFAGLGAVVDLAIGTAGLATLAASGLSAASDIAVAASDEFLLSKLGKGWKPNQFVEGPAREFLAKKDESLPAA